MTAEILYGDCRLLLRELAADSFDSLVTDPPAGISFMGKEWDSDRGGRSEWVMWMTRVSRELLRVLKPGAHGLVWALPRTSHWTALALEHAGFEVRDRFSHVFGTGFPKSLDVSKAIDQELGAEREKKRVPAEQVRNAKSVGGGHGVEGADRPWMQKARELGYHELAGDEPVTPEAARWSGWGTALKPAAEDWWLVRKPLSEANVAANVLRWGTGALAIEASQVTGERWPAHLSFSHSPECGDACAPGCPVAELDEQSGRLRSGPNPRRRGADSGRNAYGEYAGQERCAALRGLDVGGASRFFYCAKPSAADRGSSNKHPTVKPTALMSYLCRLVTPPGGRVLDPFAGSGTTGVAAVRGGYSFVGIEQDAEHAEVARRRIAEAAEGA